MIIAITIRITPTYMGNTQAGEMVLDCDVGSPPRTWGIHKDNHFLDEDNRITPTYMGNTRPSSIRMTSPRDHPHVHGEYSPSSSPNATVLGSPPRTWGILTLPLLPSVLLRITPTYMGNTDNGVRRYCFVKDHPHVHGEYLSNLENNFTR